MTDKNTIDEVNVSKCKYFNNGWCLLSESCDAIRYRLCGDMTLFDCHYRNWQRKEQECDKLYIQLKADEEYHKEEENTLRKIIKNKEERNIELYKENNKLKQTLAEIKEIAENAAKCLYATKSDDYADGYRWLGSIILQKISECEVNNDR